MGETVSSGIQFHPALAGHPYTGGIQILHMVTPADMKRVTDRWGRVANRLPAHEVKYGMALVQCLKKRSLHELAYFDDPVEAAMVFATIEVLKRRKRVRESFDP